MTPQTISQIILFFGVVASAIGGFGSYYYGKTEEKEKQAKSEETQRSLESRLAKFQATFDAKTDLIFQALKVKQDVWISIETKTVPPTSAYLLLLFRSDKGRINGKVRVQGSENTSYFSTTANDTVPVAIQNLWISQERRYKTLIIIEFTVTEKTEPDSTLNIFTHGWIDDLGQEPH